MKCIVTGGAGFIGSHLCERLLADGHTVYAVDDLSTGSRENLSSVLKNPNFSLVVSDINRPWCMFDDIDWFFHLAAKADIVPSIEDPDLYHEVNVTGTVNALQLSRQLAAKKFIYAASSSCYGIPLYYPTTEMDDCQPMYPYALTKYMGEQYVEHFRQVYALPTISLRLFNVFGPRHRTSGAYGAVFGTFLAQLANGQPLTVVGDGSQSRDFTYVTDVVDAMVMSAQSDQTGIFNVGSGGHYSVNRLVDLLGPTTFVNIPKRPGEPDVTYASIGKIKRKIGWEPKVSFVDGVAKMKELIPEYLTAPLWTPDKIKTATESWFRHLS